MIRFLFPTAALIGAAAILWMGLGFLSAHPLALAITLLIALAYGIGFAELRRYRRDTAALDAALAAPPIDEGDNTLEQWLSKLPLSLAGSVRLRVSGTQAPLPAPVLTPYLVGLLVMLGLLGTFAGMVETLDGAVLALKGSTELEAIRNGLATPIEGLGLAFGTSVAGVAASAMLGLAATLSRRERLDASRALDRACSEELKRYSNAHQQQQTFTALQTQSQALPDVAKQLGAISEQLAGLGERLQQGLESQQREFLDATRGSYEQLASSLQTSLNDSLAASARGAGEAVKPALEEALGSISREASTTQQQLRDLNEKQLESLSQGLANTSAAISAQLVESDEARMAAWQEALSAQGEAQQAANEKQAAGIRELLASSEALVQARIDTEKAWLEGHGERLDALAGSLQSPLEALREAEEARSQAALERLEKLEVTAAEQLAALGQALEAPMTSLIEVASETPAAAAAVIKDLREEISNNIERDNSLLEERQALLAQLNTLSASLEQSTEGQRLALEQMVGSSSEVLEDISGRFADQLASQAQQITDITADVAASANDMAGLGDSFSGAVEVYNQSNEQLAESLSRIESALSDSTERSDEQMAYYVAQAREIIDQSMSSQRAIIEELRQAGRQGELLAAEAG